MTRSCRDCHPTSRPLSPNVDIPQPGRPARGSATGRPIMALLDLLGRRWALRVGWELRDGEPRSFRQLQACVRRRVLQRAQRAPAGAPRPPASSSATPTAIASPRRGAELLELLLPLDAWAQAGRPPALRRAAVLRTRGRAAGACARARRRSRSASRPRRSRDGRERSPRPGCGRWRGRRRGPRRGCRSGARSRRSWWSPRTGSAAARARRAARTGCRRATSGMSNVRRAPPKYSASWRRRSSNARVIGVHAGSIAQRIDGRPASTGDGAFAVADEQQLADGTVDGGVEHARRTILGARRETTGSRGPDRTRVWLAVVVREQRAEVQAAKFISEPGATSTVVG